MSGPRSTTKPATQTSREVAEHIVLEALLWLDQANNLIPPITVDHFTAWRRGVAAACIELHQEGRPVFTAAVAQRMEQRGEEPNTWRWFNLCPDTWADLDTVGPMSAQAIVAAQYLDNLLTCAEMATRLAEAVHDLNDGNAATALKRVRSAMARLEGAA